MWCSHFRAMFGGISSMAFSEPRDGVCNQSGKCQTECEENRPGELKPSNTPVRSTRRHEGISGRSPGGSVPSRRRSHP